MVTARVLDASTGKPLTYAILVYMKQQTIGYTDANGYFSVHKDSLLVNDSVCVQFLGYIQKYFAVAALTDGMQINLQPAEQNLAPVIVSNCRKKDFTVNRKTGRIKDYIGPGPETKLVVMAKYANTSGKPGFVKGISMLIDEKMKSLKVPVRLRWYSWNTIFNRPDKELTDTSIIVYPYKSGWNDFDLPVNAIWCPDDFIVFGLEFIYTPEYKEAYDKLKGNNDKIEWLNDMQNRWSLALQYVSDASESGFYMLNNNDVKQYDKKYDRYYVRPALRFTIEICED